MTDEDLLSLSYNGLLIATIISMLFIFSSFSILVRLRKTLTNVVNLAPRLDDPEFHDERINMEENIFNLSTWVRDLRYFIWMHVALVAVSWYNIVYEDIVHPLIALILIGTQMYLWTTNKNYRTKLGAALGLNMAMSQLLIASDLLKVFKDHEYNVSKSDIKVDIVKKED